MYCLIAAEAAIFTIFVVAYLFYMGKSLSGPTPQQVLHVPVLFTICLLSSSVTIHLAVRSLRKAKVGAFARWWFLTLLLGSTFLAGTALEWRHLIYDEGLMIQTNLFGTTYYSLVGLHAFHVLMGLLALGHPPGQGDTLRDGAPHASRLGGPRGVAGGRHHLAHGVTLQCAVLGGPGVVYLTAHPRLGRCLHAGESLLELTAEPAGITGHVHPSA